MLSGSTGGVMISLYRGVSSKMPEYASVVSLDWKGVTRPSMKLVLPCPRRRGGLLYDPGVGVGIIVYRIAEDENTQM
jgi:hypothetical protein